MKFLTLPAVLAAALLAAVVIVPWLPASRSRAGNFALEARLASTVSGHAQLYRDTGAGLSEAASERRAVVAGAAALLRFNLPDGDYAGFRLDPLDRDGTVVIESLRVVAHHGRVLREIAPAEIRAENEIASLTPSARGLVAVLAPGATDPQLSIRFTPPLVVRTSARELAAQFSPRWLAALAVLLALLFACDRATPAVRTHVAALRASLATHPLRALALVAALAVAASAYPVVFLGKSYVSPDLGTILLYDDYPTLPGYASGPLPDVKGSDIGATAWQDVPFAVTQRRALLVHGELPLWNRYNSAGTPLLGQGQSMFGDPLHFLPILANSSAWSWDAKFLLAKFLFALGLGLAVHALTRSLPASLVVAASAPFIGFFIYRVNHPAFFSLCYSPWVLVAWLRFLAAPARRAAAAWLGGLLLANWSLLNSGTVKEAYMLLLSLNLAGALALLATDRPWRERLLRLAAAAWAGLVFALLAAPVLLPFFDTLATAYTSYNTPSAYQIQPGLLLGFFDELFYRPLSGGELVFNPSLNLVLLAGVLLFLATLRENFSLRPALGLAVAALLPLSLAFGLVPARWIVRLPFLANIAHIDNTFSCVLLVLAAVLAGVGFFRAFARLGTPAGRGDLAIAGLLLFALVFGYVSFSQAVHRSVFGLGTVFTFMKPGESLPVAPFVWAFLGVALAALALGGCVLRHALAAGRFSPAAALALAACAFVLLWRHGLHAGAGFENYVVQPPQRVNLRARSPAVEFLRTAQRAEPSRAIGLRGNFFPGWTGYYGLESVAGPDALVNPRYRELTEASGFERLWDWRYYFTPENLPAARPLLDALNVRHYLDYRSDQARLGAIVRLVQPSDLDLYESPAAWPRAFFTDRLAPYADAKEFVSLVRAGDGRPFAAAEKKDLAADRALAALPPATAARTVVPATRYALTPNTTAFTIQAPGPGLALLLEAHLPGDFRAELDGRRVPVLRLNHAFKGVLIPAAGEHRVRFTYRPRRFTRALLAALAGLGLLAASAWFARRAPVPA